MRFTIDADGVQTVLFVTGSGFSSDIIDVFQIKKDPPRLVIDCKSCPLPKLGTTSKNHQLEIEGRGLVEKLRMARRPKGELRIVLDLSRRPERWDKTVEAGKITLSLTGALAGEANRDARLARSQLPIPRLKPNASRTAKRAIKRIEPTESQNQSSTSKSVKVLAANYSIPAPRLKPLPRQKPGLVKRVKPIIVIDPGHGGHDPGAIGKRGTHEKSITLKAAHELKRQLIKTGRYKVILTRTDDRYIKHDERLRIARADGADLFISIHADSAGPSARGASVYTLADRAIGRSKHIVDSQNWIMDVDLSKQSDPVGDILVDLAQRKTFSHSTRFADDLIRHLEPKTKLIGNTHRRAGYFVLLAPDVPAVLLELGFISNAEDEKLLQSSRHRAKLMSAVTTAINKYFDRQKP